LIFMRQYIVDIGHIRRYTFHSRTRHAHGTRTRLA
jgi:hypothetical protein